MFTLKSLAGFLTLTLFSATQAIAQHPTPPQPGDVVFQTDFDSPKQQAAWSKADSARWGTGYQDSTSLCVTVSPDNATTTVR